MSEKRNRRKKKRAKDPKDRDLQRILSKCREVSGLAEDLREKMATIENSVKEDPRLFEDLRKEFADDPEILELVGQLEKSVSSELN